MKISFDTTAFHEREELLKKLVELSKKMKMRGKAKNTASAKDPAASPQQLSIEQLLFLEIMMGSVKGVALTLELGADPDECIKGKSARQLAKAFNEPKIIRVIEDYSPSPRVKKRLKLKP